jgi:hypothetical protein
MGGEIQVTNLDELLAQRDSAIELLDGPGVAGTRVIEKDRILLVSHSYTFDEMTAIAKWWLWLMEPAPWPFCDTDHALDECPGTVRVYEGEVKE